jgi:hypothetical protein
MFEKANQMYHNKMYDSAVTLYQQMIDDGYCSADLYYNAGNAYYRNNQLGMSIWCFRKAQQIHSTKNIEDNLALAQRRIKDPIREADDIFFIRWWKGMYSLFSVNGWAIVAISLFLLAMVIFFVRLYKSSFLNKRIANTMLFFSIVALFFMAVRYYQSVYHYHGIITQSNTYFRKSINSEPILLNIGIEVVYEGKGKTGILFKLPDGQVGQIDGDKFKKL